MLAEVQEDKEEEEEDKQEDSGTLYLPKDFQC